MLRQLWRLSRGSEKKRERGVNREEQVIFRPLRETTKQREDSLFSFFVSVECVKKKKEDDEEGRRRKKKRGAKEARERAPRSSHAAAADDNASSGGGGLSVLIS